MTAKKFPPISFPKLRPGRSVKWQPTPSGGQRARSGDPRIRGFRRTFGPRDLCERREPARCWLAHRRRNAFGAFCRLHLPVMSDGVPTTESEAVDLATKIGYPVAVKLASHELVHKTEVGGVCLNLADAAAVRQAFQEIRGRLEKLGRLDAMDGVVVQPMIEGVEVMAGVTQEAQFGPLVAFGLGGIYVEILADVCFRVTPLGDRDAAEMVRTIRGYRLFEGYRGRPPADIPAIHDLLLRLSRLVEDVPEIGEVDLNPVFAMATGRGCLIADARIGVRPAK